MYEITLMRTKSFSFCFFGKYKHPGKKQWQCHVHCAVLLHQGPEFTGRLMREWDISDKPSLDLAVEECFSAGIALLQEASARMQVRRPLMARCCLYPYPNNKNVQARMSSITCMHAHATRSELHARAW